MNQVPNHVSNLLRIRGDAPTVDMLLKIIPDADHEFSFNRIIPMPPEHEADWYSWNVKHWGTKWNSYDVEIIKDNPFFKMEGVEIRFNTAWSPPVPVIRAMSCMFPDLSIQHYFEDEGECFHPGWITFENGEQTEEKTFNPSNDHEFDEWKQLEIFEDYESYKERMEEYKKDNDGE